jgi:hypothetical protein
MAAKAARSGVVDGLDNFLQTVMQEAGARYPDARFIFMGFVPNGDDMEAKVATTFKVSEHTEALQSYLDEQELLVEKVSQKGN